MNFEIFDDIFDMEQVRINRNFHQSEHDQFYRSQRQPCVEEFEEIEERVRDEYEKNKGDTKHNPFQRDQNIKKLRYAAGGFKPKKPSMTQDEIMEDLAKCRANQSLMMPQHKNIRFERFCKDPVAFYLYKRKNLFLEDKLAKKSEEKLNQKRRMMLQMISQKQEKARKEAEKKAQMSARSTQMNPIIRANKSGNQTARPHHSSHKLNQLSTTFSNPALKAYETAPQQRSTHFPGIKGAKVQETPRRAFIKVNLEGGGSIGDSRDSKSKFSNVPRAFRVSTASESTRKSARPLIEEMTNDNTEIMDPFSPSFNSRLMIKQKQKRLPARLPQSIKCKEEEEQKLNRILQGCDFALFGDPFRMDQVRMKQRYTQAVNNNFDKAYQIMKEFDYADAQMLEVLYQYKLDDLDNIKEEERAVANEYKVNSKETSRMLTQINSKMMRAKNRKKKP